MNMEIPAIQRAEPFDATPLAKLAEKTFRDAFAPFINPEDFESYVASSFTENQIRSELLDSATTFFIARITQGMKASLLIWSRRILSVSPGTPKMIS